MRTVRSLGFFLPLLFVVLIFVALIAVSTQNAAAQANRASITGTVTDSTGAVVAGAEVTATNTGTNVPTKTVSNKDGIYVIPNLFPGQYSVEFKKDGFAVLLRSVVNLESTEVARLDAALKIGAVSETMTVTTDAPVMDMERPSEGTNMKGSVVEALPLSIYSGGRFIETFAVALTPGYSVYSSPYGAVVNGGQWFTKDYTVDGTSGTASFQGNSMSGGPAMESVQEVQAQTSGLDAQSSITGGSVIAMNLKSGTNQFHGSAFLYGHNELLDANTWNNDYLGDPKPKKRAWDYGFSLGGPIYKNKTFFFGTFERFQQVDWRLAGGSQTVPTQKMLGGDFSELLGAVIPGSMVYNWAGQYIPAQVNMIYDPTSDAPGSTCLGANPPPGQSQTPCQFTGNVIPANRLSTTSQKVAAIYKQYYAPQYGGVDNNSRGLLAGTPTQTPNQFVVKLDHVLREQDRVSASWIYNRRPSLLDDSGGIWQQGTQNGGPLSDARNVFFYNHQVRLSESHTFSPRVLNVLNFTYNMDYQNAAPTDPGNWSSQLGFGNTGANTFPFLNFNDQYAYYGHTESYAGSVWQGNFSGVNVINGDALTWTKGRHNLTFGGDFTARQINSRTGSGALSFDFPFWYTSGPNYPYDGFSFASFMLGMADRASESVAHNLYGRQKELDLFAQDNYKVSSKLTLSMGLRWNYNFRFHEKYGNWANYDLNAINPNYSAPGLLVFAKNGGDSFEKNEYAKNFGPSFGFAYALKPKTVVRGSFGLIYNPPGLDFSNGVPNAFAPQLGINQTGAISNWDNGYPGTVTKPDANTPPISPSLFPVTSVDPRALRIGYSEAFNFGIQQELTPNTRLEISYVGNRGHRLTDSSLAWNEGSAANFTRLGKQGLLGNWVCDAATAAQYGVPYPSGNKYVYGNFCGPVLAAMAPYPQLADADTNYWGYDSLLYAGLPLGQSFYDSMVVDVVKRTGRGLTMDMSYTWSRQEGDSFSSQQGGNGYYTGVQDFSNMRQAAHAITGYDLAHVVKGFVSYELPFGKGRQWFNGGGRVVNAIASGWTTTAVVEYNSGQPFEVSASNPYWPLWGNIYPQFNLAGYTGPNSTSHFVPLPANWQGPPPASNIYMPSTVASNPAAGVLPPSPATSALRCPGQANEDVSVLKNFGMGSEGQYRLQFRTEFYNLFNRHYYLIQGCDSLRSDVGASNFGQILSVMDNPRNAQFGIRFEF
jgi:hypothetical protein